MSGEPWSFVHILGFSFINDLITDSYLNVELMLSSLSDFCNSQKKLAKNDDDPLNLLTYWDYLEDNEVKKYLAILSEKVRDNLYEYSLYPKIIDKLLRLSIMGFDASIEETIGFMKNNIRQEINVNIQTIDSFIYPNNDEYNERLLSYLNQINEEIEKKHIKGFTNGINACVTGKEGWGKQLIDYVDTHRNELMNKRRFVSLFDTTNFCESILKSKNKDIEDVRRAFQSVYNFSNIRDFYKNDYSSISVIIDRLKETQKGDHKFGIIKFECINYFINQLSEYLSRLD